MDKVIGYKCSKCGQEFGLDEVTYLCPADGGVLDVVLDYEGIKKAAKADIPTWTAADLPVEPKKIGFDGSPTWVMRVFTPEQRGGGEMLEGEIPEMVSQLVDKLLEAKVLK